MICGFCPGPGSSQEKSFNRADVFKRHLTSVHGVEQTPPNSRKRSPGGSSSTKASTRSNDVSGKCSTCSATFSNAQDLYEHLDECVLRVVQQEEPSEAINESLLRSVADDENVREVLNRHMLPTGLDVGVENPTTSDAEDGEENDDESMDESLEHKSHPSIRSGKGNMVSKKGYQS